MTVIISDIHHWSILIDAFYRYHDIDCVYHPNQLDIKIRVLEEFINIFFFW